MFRPLFNLYGPLWEEIGDLFGGLSSKLDAVNDNERTHGGWIGGWWWYT